MTINTRAIGINLKAGQGPKALERLNLHPAEEVPELERGRLRRVRAVRGVVLDRRPEVLPQRAGSALAGSVAPMSVRHFLMASGASSTITMHGPDDMKSVRLPKNGRARCTA